MGKVYANCMFRAAAMLAVLISVIGQAEPLCVTEVRVNDSGAKIAVDGVYGYVAPFELQCKENSQFLQVESSDGQSFNRTIPAKKDFTVSDRFLNVYFRPKGIVTPGYSPASDKHVMTESEKDSQVLVELRALRKMVESLMAQYPELKQMLAAQKQKTEAPIVTVALPTSLGRNVTTLPNTLEDVSRNVNSVAAPVASHLQGYYVQLHAFSRKKFDTAAVQGEIIKNRSVASAVDLDFCKRPSQLARPDWTFVVYGPFPTAEVARSVVKMIGRDTFMVHNPECAQHIESRLNNK